MKYNSILAELKKIKNLTKNNPVYITGHSNTDLDSYCSSLLVTKLLQMANIYAIPIVNSKDDVEHIKNICLTSKIEYVPVKVHTVCNSDYVFIVDHSNLDLSCKVGYIVGCIDHHTNKKVCNIFNYTMKHSSTCILIYKLFKELKISFTNEEKKQILFATYSDTNGLKSVTRVNPEVINLCNNLKKELNLTNSYIKKCALDYTDFTKPLDSIINSYRKDINIKGIQTITSCIYYDDVTKEVIAVREKILDKFKNTDLFILIEIDYNTNSVIIYAAGRLAYKVPYTKWNQIVSRIDIIVPFIEDLLD